jgi:hypothetical protein
MISPTETSPHAITKSQPLAEKSKTIGEGMNSLKNEYRNKNYLVDQSKTQ